MPHYLVGQPVFLVRPNIPNPRMNLRLPVYQQLPRPPLLPPPPLPPRAVVRNQVPRQLPVLHAPFFPKENEYYEEEEEQQQYYEYEHMHPYPTMSIPDQHGTLIQQYPNYPFVPPYPKQQLIHPVQPRPPSYVYYHR